MSTAQHGPPQGQAGSWAGHPGNGAAPAPGPGWQPGPPSTTVRGSRGAAIAIGIVGLLAVAALIVGIMALVRPLPAAPGATPSTAPTKPTGTPEANRAFCTDIAPLMTASNQSAQAFNKAGKPNTPEWKTGAQAFVSDTKAWVGHMQSVIDSHGDADGFLVRSMQRFVDDRRSLIADVTAGDDPPSWLPYDQTNWNDSLSALAGPLGECNDLGVKW
jgi:hypothetical protein